MGGHRAVSHFPVALRWRPGPPPRWSRATTVVLKGASATPWAGRMLAIASADAWRAARHVLCSTMSAARATVVGAALIGHPLTAGVTFTGSHEVG